MLRTGTARNHHIRGPWARKLEKTGPESQCTGRTWTWASEGTHQRQGNPRAHVNNAFGALRGSGTGDDDADGKEW